MTSDKERTAASASGNQSVTKSRITDIRSQEQPVRLGGDLRRDLAFGAGLTDGKSRIC
jgi:hypothetical protein